MNADAPSHATLAADWLAADALVVAFIVLVTLILDIVPGWSAPLRAWLALGTWVFTALALHAVSQAMRAAHGRRWGRAGIAAGCGAGLALAAAVMVVLAMRLPSGTLHDVDDAVVRATSAPR